MRNLSDFNDIYNIQDVFILSLIAKIKDETGFDPRCFTSARTLSGTIERIKSKVILTYPRKRRSSRSYGKPSKWWLFFCTHEIKF